MNDLCQNKQQGSKPLIVYPLIDDDDSDDSGLFYYLEHHRDSRRHLLESETS